MLCRERQKQQQASRCAGTATVVRVTGQRIPIWPHHLFAIMAHALILIPTEAHIHPVVEKIGEVCDFKVQAVELERLCRLQHIQMHGALSCVCHVCLSFVPNKVGFLEEICDFVQLWHEIGVGS